MEFVAPVASRAFGVNPRVTPCGIPPPGIRWAVYTRWGYERRRRGLHEHTYLHGDRNVVRSLRGIRAQRGRRCGRRLGLDVEAKTGTLVVTSDGPVADVQTLSAVAEAGYSAVRAP